MEAISYFGPNAMRIYISSSTTAYLSVISLMLRCACKASIVRDSVLNKGDNRSERLPIG